MIHEEKKHQNTSGEAPAGSMPLDPHPLGHPVIRLHDHHIAFLQSVQHLHMGG